VRPKGAASCHAAKSASQRPRGRWGGEQSRKSMISNTLRLSHPTAKGGKEFGRWVSLAGTQRVIENRIGFACRWLSRAFLDQRSRGRLPFPRINGVSAKPCRALPRVWSNRQGQIWGSRDIGDQTGLPGNDPHHFPVVLCNHAFEVFWVPGFAKDSADLGACRACPICP
jgi:hypothetical protein